MSEIEPHAPDDTVVLEGEIVPRPVSLPRQFAGTVQTVAAHPHTRAVVRNAVYVAIGVFAIGKRLWDSRTSARYERWMRGAEQAGDRESLLELERRLSSFRKDRHQRRKDWIELPVHIVQQLPKIAIGFVAVLALIGGLLAAATHNTREIATPFIVLARVTEIVVIVVSVAWGPLVLAAPWVAVIFLWWFGRSYASATTGWLAPPRQDDDTGVVVTADTIVLALQNLRIPELKKAFKEDWKPVFHTLPVRDGRGYLAVFSIPLGVTAALVADQRAVLARNVHRAEVEVWPSDAALAGMGPAGTVALWIADNGVLSKPAPEYPLLHEGTADVFEGVPGGVSPRGDQVTIPVVSNNMVAGGQMGQGKSNACRVVMLGCALDPLAELDVFVFANNGDFDAFEPRLARYYKGVEDDTIAAAMNRLHELYAEVARREGRLAELGAKKVTRGLAKAHRDLRPIVALFSECHELFGHEDKAIRVLAADLAAKTAKRARKTGITLIFDTQSSRKEAIPPKLVELVSVNVCFYVKTWRSNDGFLGDGSFAAGIRATELRPGRDRGTSLITGVSDAQFELLKWHFVEVNDDTGFDAAAEVIARAVAKAAPGTRMAAAGPVPAIEARDLLTDLDSVLGHDRVKVADLPALLRELAPTWGPYRTLTGVQLRDQLDGAGVRMTNTRNIRQVDPADLREVLAGRK